MKRSAIPAQQTPYFPGPGDGWERRAPAELGIDPTKLQKAIDYSVVHETPSDRDVLADLHHRHGGKRHDDGVILGPAKRRGGVSGLVIRHGYVAAEWGDPGRVDVTFSATKSYLSSIFGLALDRGLIRDVHDRVGEYVQDGHFDSPHNSKITWHHLLQQTSEWDGTLWDKHYAAGNKDDLLREPLEPGTHFEYNDVRVNLLALALLRIWRRSLPEVLKEHVMGPIGASDTWEWHGYRNSYVTIDGTPMQSVSGGCHWGGGIWTDTWDHARFGYLFLRRGRWDGRQLISERWIEMATAPCEVMSTYGYMWWLNTDRAYVPAASATNFFASGWGGNRIWIDPVTDTVVVVRWLDPSGPYAEFAELIADAVK